MNRKDFTGMRFGMLVVLGFSGEKTKCKNYIWICKCDCGNIVNVAGGNLKHSKVNSCGCYKFNRIDEHRAEKVCSKCKENKSISEFGKNKNRKDGHSHFCKKCVSELDKYYRPRQTEYRNKYARNKRKNNISFRIADNLRRRINSVINKNIKNKKSGSMPELIGCNIDLFISHIENKFSDKMNWNNYGTYWVIDHIRPCASFDLSQESQQKECFHYSNMQPMEKEENISKGSLYNGKRYKYE